MSTTQPPRPKRRCYQFSLKTLLVVMTIATVAFGGWVQYRRQRARENRDRVASSEKAINTAVAAVEELGGTVTSAYEKRRPQTWLERHFNDPGGADDPVGVLTVTSVVIGDAKMAENAKTFPAMSVMFAVFDRDTVYDADLIHVKEFTELEHLDLSLQTNLTDAGLKHLEGLTSLRDLNLAGITNFTAVGLEHLKGLTKLKRRNLSDAQVDAGLQHLKGMNQLQSLDLAFTKVTDAGLEHLTELKSLQSLELPFTNVTDEGVQNLQQALPNCKITRVPPRLDIF